MSFEEAKERFEEASGVDDVAEKGFLMFQAFEKILSGLDMDSVKDLNGFDGFLYKNSQGFLMASSTYEKEQKLEKILDCVERKYISD